MASGEALFEKLTKEKSTDADQSFPDLAGLALEPMGPAPARRVRADAPHTAGWSVAIVVLLALIVAQYSYFMRSDLAKYPQLRPWLETLCQVTGCEIPLLRTPSKIALVSRDIRTHPSVKGALLVRAAFTNEAQYTQAYPILRLDLSDVNGTIVATRHFQPEEYLSRDMNASKGLATGERVHVELEIVDPDKSAVGFEISFI